MRTLGDRGSTNIAHCTLFGEEARPSCRGPNATRLTPSGTREETAQLMYRRREHEACHRAKRGKQWGQPCQSTLCSTLRLEGFSKGTVFHDLLNRLITGAEGRTTNRFIQGNCPSILWPDHRVLEPVPQDVPPCHQSCTSGRAKRLNVVICQSNAVCCELPQVRGQHHRVVGGLEVNIIIPKICPSRLK